jgi:hypothetical protein
MNRSIETRLNMGQRVLEFSRAHSSPSQGYAIALKQLEELLARASQLEKEQRQGIAEVRATTSTKHKLRRAIRRGHLVHLAGVAGRASAEDPELAQQFDLPRMPKRGLAFRAAARTMIDLAEQQKELLGKYGLVDDVVQNARKSIDQLDAAVERGAEGRRMHIGASASLLVIASEVVRQVRILDGFNRVRFADDPNLLAGWIAATNVIGPPRSEAEAEDRSGGGSAPSPNAPPPGQIKPAA